MAKNPDKLLCAKCPALCCKYITVETEKLDDKRHYDDIRWYLLHEGISLLIEEERWLLQIPTPCTKLTKDGRCRIYKNRPETCREYQTENCDYYTEFEDCDTEYLLIETPKAFKKYLKKQKRKKAKKKK